MENIELKVNENEPGTVSGVDTDTAFVTGMTVINDRPTDNESTTTINDENGTALSTNSENDIVTDENYKTFKLLNLKSKLSDINYIMKNIETEQSRFVDDSEDFDPIDKILDNFTEAQLKTLSYAQVNEILVDSEGNPIEFTIDFDGDDAKMNQFKKDFLIMRKQSNTVISNFEKELENINKEIAEYQEDFDKAINDFGNVGTLIQHTLNEKIENAKDDHTKELYTKLLVSFNHGLNLDNVKAFCKTYKGRNIISDYRLDKRSNYIYRQYLRVIKKLNIITDLTSFTNLEARFLPVGYNERPNIFVFAVISYIASWNNTEFTKADGLFLTQFTVNLKNLYYDKFDNEVDKEVFINNIKDIINIIG